LDAADTVNGFIEQDIIDVFEEWRRKRADERRDAA
jgi:hypothetical protein